MASSARTTWTVNERFFVASLSGPRPMMVRVLHFAILSLGALAETLSSRSKAHPAEVTA